MTSINAFKDKVGDQAIDVLLNIAGKPLVGVAIEVIDSARYNGTPRTGQLDHDQPFRLGEDFRRQHVWTSSPDTGTSSKSLEVFFSENRKHGKLEAVQRVLLACFRRLMQSSLRELAP